MTAPPTRQMPRHILQLTAAEKRQFLNSFDYVFSDIDGVLWNYTDKIENSVDGFKALQKANKSLHFVTNNSVRTMQQYEKKFKSIDFDFVMQNLWHPARTMAAYLKSIKFNGLIYIIAADNFKKTMRAAGFQLFDGPTKVLNEAIEHFMYEVFDREPVAAVIIDFDYNMSAAKLMKAQLYLRRPDCKLLVGATDMYLPLGNGENLIGPGPFAKILMDACEQTAIVIGKPGKDLADILVHELQIPDRKRVLMIGDMLEQDVEFGKAAGFQTLVVLSGGCTKQDLAANTESKWQADYYADSVKDFIQFMQAMK